MRIVIIFSSNSTINKPLVLKQVHMSLQLVDLPLQMSNHLILLHLFAINVILELLVDHLRRDFRENNRPIDLPLQVNRKVSGLIISVQVGMLHMPLSHRLLELEDYDSLLFLKLESLSPL